jgi:hypothetical protein
MIHKFKTKDAPTANGREPKFGEQQWTLTFPHENGDDYIEIILGKKGRDAVKAMIAQEEKDDAEGVVPCFSCGSPTKDGLCTRNGCCDSI